MDLRRIAAVLAAVFVVAGTSAAGARAADVPPGFFGLGDWGYPDDARAAELSGSGLRVYRAALLWSVAENQQGVRVWTTPDRLAAQAQRDGFNIVFVLSGCPAWACGSTAAPPRGDPALPGFLDFVAEAVSRYRPSGSFWTGTTGGVPRVMWQVGNEVNGGHYFGNDPDPAAYARFLGLVSSTIKGIDGGATVIASGLVETPSDPSGVPLETFLRGLYRQPGYASSFDVAALHAYAEDPDGTVRTLDRMRRIMVEAGDASRPLWVTEMGWGTGGPPHPFAVDEARQATYLRTAWDTMLACRARWNLQRVMWFAYTDIDAAAIGEQDSWGVHSGLLRRDLSAKPARAVFNDYLGAVLPPGHAATCSLPGGDTLDLNAPETMITAPRITNRVTGPPIRFSSNEQGARFECSFDAAHAWRGCTSPQKIPAGRDGAHWLRVRAIDAQGNVDQTPARADWTLDRTPPITNLWSRVPRTTRKTRVRLLFAGTDDVAVAGFQCRVDRGAPRRCTSPFRTRKLRPGRHRIVVRAIDKAGNVDPTPFAALVRVAGKRR